MTKIITGSHIIIHQLNDFFNHVSAMLIEHFDKPKYNKYLFILGSYLSTPLEEIRKQFPNYKLVVYQLEQLMGGCDNHYIVSNIINNIRSADEIWDYDYLNADYLNEHSINVTKIVPMLYTKSLDTISNLENPDIDVLFYGWINDRRYKVFVELQKVLLNKVKLVWVYGESNIEKYISNSKLILNIHAYEPWNRQEQVRMFFPLINGKTNISEPSQINYLKDEILESNLSDLGNTIIECCYNNTWRSFGLTAKERFKNRTEKFIVDNII